MKLLRLLPLVFFACSPAESFGAITLSLDHAGSNLIEGQTDTYTIFLNVDGVLPDPTVPPNSVPTPMSDFSFEVQALGVGGGAATFTSASLAAAFTPAGTATPGGSSATFEWSGPGFALSNQFALGTFTIEATNAGTVGIRIRERTVGNNAVPALGAVTSDFIFQAPSDPIGGDNQLFTVGSAGSLLSTAELASLSIIPIPEPTSTVMAGLASACLLLMRRRRNEV